MSDKTVRPKGMKRIILLTTFLLQNAYRMPVVGYVDDDAAVQMPRFGEEVRSVQIGFGDLVG